MLKSHKTKLCIAVLLLGVLIYPLITSALDEPREAMTIAYITEEETEPILHQHHENRRDIVDVTIFLYPVSRIDIIDTDEVLWIDASVISYEGFQNALRGRFAEGKKTIVLGYNQPTQELADFFGFLEKKDNLRIPDDPSLAGYAVQKVAHHEVAMSIYYDFADKPDSFPVDPLVSVSRKDLAELFQVND